MKYTVPILLIAFISICIFLSLNANKLPGKLIWSDMEGYYVYLPATFIHGGFSGFQVKDTSYLKPWPNTDKIYTKYTSGVALLEAPFFLTAHLLSKPLGYESDGYSLIYSYALMAAGVFYMVMGLIFLWHILKKYYSRLVSMIALGGIIFGTNLYYYTFFQPSMSHVYSFSLFAMLLWITEKIFSPATPVKNNSILNWSLFGLIAGLIVLIRPTNIVVLLYPLYRFWKEYDPAYHFLKHQARYLLIAALCFCIVWIPQIFYWHSVTGSFFMWSYGEESFKYWQEPKLIRVLIDPWNGWLLYSPIVILPLTGLFLKSNYNPYYNKVTCIILIVATYIFASWWAWWFGGAFGHRSYVEYYALLALPFGQVVTVAFRKKWLSILFIVFYLFFIYYNIGLTYLYQPPWDGPSWTYQSLLNEIKKLL